MGEIHSIRDRDLREILGHFGLDSKVDNGQIVCKFCARAITWENIGALFIENNEAVLYCDFSECLETVSKKQEG